jgi:hypothetical protein
MWKSVFLAAGIFACVLGVELLIVDSAVVSSIDGQAPSRTVTAPDWAPWTLISLGAVTILHFANLQAKAATSITKSPVGGHW